MEFSDGGSVVAGQEQPQLGFDSLSPVNWSVCTYLGRYRNPLTPWLGSGVPWSTCHGMEVWNFIEGTPSAHDRAEGTRSSAALVGKSTVF